MNTHKRDNPRGNISFYANKNDHNLLNYLCDIYQINRSALIRKLITEAAWEEKRKESSGE